MSFKEEMMEALDVIDSVSEEHFEKIWNAAQDNYRKQVLDVIEELEREYSRFDKIKCGGCDAIYDYPYGVKEGVLKDVEKELEIEKYLIEELGVNRTKLIVEFAKKHHLFLSEASRLIEFAEKRKELPLIKKELGL